MKKQIIWDLFGGGCNSISRAIQNNNLQDDYIVYTFDVVETHKESFRGQTDFKFQTYINIDLSSNDIVENLNKLITQNTIQKPDIIISSTLCQSFSKVLSIVGGGTCFWKQEIRGDKNSPLIERSVEEFEKLKSGFTKRLRADKQLFIKRLGEQCATNSVKIIQHFQPKFWYIENPDSSMLFQFLRVNLNFKGFENIACFGAYGFAQNKSGCFYSNVKFKLDRTKKPTTYQTMWEEVPKEYYDEWMDLVEYKKNNLNSSGDRRHVKKEIIDGIEKYYRRWYVDIGYQIGDKGHSSMKKTTMTLGKLTKQKFALKTINDFDTKQIGEANETSHIPEGVIVGILKNFK